MNNKEYHILIGDKNKALDFMKINFPDVTPFDWGPMTKWDVTPATTYFWTSDRHQHMFYVGEFKSIGVFADWDEDYIKKNYSTIYRKLTTNKES